MNLREEINKLKEEGYNQQNAQARICQDIILDAIAKCHLSKNIKEKLAGFKFGTSAAERFGVC